MYKKNKINIGDIITNGYSNYKIIVINYKCGAIDSLFLQQVGTNKMMCVSVNKLIDWERV